MSWIGGLLVTISTPVLFWAGYLFVLTLLSRQRRPPSLEVAPLRFVVVIPAHDEEAGIAATIASIRATDYPSAYRRILVVADNCTDDTDAVARASGVQTLVRCDPNHRGKGLALALAFARCAQEGFAEAVVVIDADTIVSRNLFWAFAARVRAGAHVLQADYGVRNREDSWRTRLMAVAFAAFHQVRSIARERLGLSVGLRGNGMAFSMEVLSAVPYRAFSLVEDVEYGLELGLAGHRVSYVSEAKVLGEMPSSHHGASAQRARWELGRRTLARKYCASTYREALRRRSAVLFNLATDLTVPPLTRLVSLSVLGASLAIASGAAGHGSIAVLPWVTSLAFLTAYVLRGVALAGGLRDLRTLPWVPVYIAWKVLLTARWQKPTYWTRTPRERRP